MLCPYTGYEGQVLYDLYVYVVSVNYNIFKNVDSLPQPVSTRWRQNVLWTVSHGCRVALSNPPRRHRALY